MNSTWKLSSLVVVLVVALSWASCGGGAAVEGQVGPIGGELCLPNRKVCINIPMGALETQQLLRIAPGADVPGGAFSDGYDIGPSNGKPLTLLKPATVSIALEDDRVASLENVNLLRVYSKGGGDWEPLDNPFVDRVQNVVKGETNHLSPFVLLRSDRLPDGGLPMEIDGGVRDAGVIIIPPFDAGRPDAGRPDAGRPDAGFDAGTDSGIMDSGVSDAGPIDSGVMDAGVPDAGPVDAGTPDAGPADAGVPDAGPADAGAPDAGPPDAGPEDAGVPDAGEVDAGEPDAGEDAGVDAG